MEKVWKFAVFKKYIFILNDLSNFQRHHMFCYQWCIIVPNTHYNIVLSWRHRDHMVPIFFLCTRKVMCTVDCKITVFASKCLNIITTTQLKLIYEHPFDQKLQYKATCIFVWSYLFWHCTLLIISYCDLGAQIHPRFTHVTQTQFS